MPRLRAWFSRLIGLFQKNKRDAEMSMKRETQRCDNSAESNR